MNKQNSIARRLTVSILIVCLLATGIQVKAQDNLANDELLIKNMTPKQVKFWVRKGNANWGQPLYLNSRSGSIFKDIDQIWIEGVHKKLQLKVRYYIEWDDAGKKFRVVELCLRKPCDV